MSRLWSQGLCLLVCVGLLLPFMSEGKQYTNSWAVQVEGGEEIARELARKHGFDFKGKIGNLDGVYHFELFEGTGEHSPHKTTALQEESMVQFVEQQHYKKMAKKDPR